MNRWPNIGLWGDFEPCEDGILEAINQNFFILDVLVQLAIIDFVTELPEDPDPGDKYILESDTYAYTGGPNSIMIWDGNKWITINPNPGHIAYVSNEDNFFWYNGSDWVLLPKNLGDVNGPSSSANNSIARFDGITGKWITDSGILLDDDNVISNVSALYTERTLTGLVNIDFQVDAASSGTDYNVPSPLSCVVKFTNAALDSIDSIAAPGDNNYGQLHVFVNETGKTLIFNNGTSIRTGTNNDLSVGNGAAIWCVYDPVSTQWIVIGGSGGGGTADSYYTTDDTDMKVNTHYLVNKAGSQCVLTLPDDAAIGDRIKITGISADGWAIYNNSSVSNTTLYDDEVNRSAPSGSTNSLYQSTSGHSAIEVVCTEEGGTAWTVFSRNGGVLVANYFGTGVDGDEVISSNTSLTPPGITGSYDAEMVIKNYKNLTIDSGVTLTTNQPCRGMLLYVDGDLTVNGTLSMTGRGPFVNPEDVGVSSSGLYIRRYKSGGTTTWSAPDDDLLNGCGTSAVSSENNQPLIPGPVIEVNIPKVGGAGGVDSGSQQDGQTKTDGTGGGGTGGRYTASAGAGTAGTCFSGGSGGGGAGISGDGGSNATAYGGAGGAGAGSGGGQGAGNPGGGGLGGLLILIVRGDVTVGATGSIQANGGNGGGSAYGGGGGGGGGRIILLHGGTLTNNGSITANGGTGANGGNGIANKGSDGGNGSITTSQIFA